MKIYLASRYSRYQEMQGYASIIRNIGFEITSRWINGDHQISDKGLSLQADEKKRVSFAMEDIHDLQSSDIVICFTEVPRTTNSRGGRHVEMGIAIGWNKKIIIVGYRENVFCCLPELTFFTSVSELLHYLREIINV